MKKLVSILCVFASLFLQAQQDSCGANSCTRKNAGSYLIELAGCGNYIDIYLYDSKGRPVRGIDLSGYVDLFYPDESSLTSELQQYEKSNALRAKITYPGFYNFKVTLVIKEKIISAYFDNECYLIADQVK